MNPTKTLTILSLLLLLSPLALAYDYIDLNEEVSLHTGDLAFDIPLVTVPGRNGLDYTISLDYTAGIPVNQDAGPAGLGWDLNVDAISRTTLGVPDDFCGGCLNADYNYKVWHKKNLHTDSGADQIIRSLATPQTFMSLSSPTSVAMKVTNVVAFAMSNSEEDQVKHNCNGWCNIKANGFKWYDVNENGGDDVYYAFDIQSPDLYTLSGDSINGQLVMTNNPAIPALPRFHLKKTPGHASDQVEMTQCDDDIASIDFCEDTVEVDYTYDPLDHSFETIKITDVDGSEYVFAPTKWYEVDDGDGFSLRTRRTTRKQDTCTWDEYHYTETQMMDDFAYEFGLIEIHSPNFEDVGHNGAGPEDDGNWVTITYGNSISDYHTRDPHEDACMEGPAGEKIVSESYQSMTFPTRIDTPTHYAEIMYANDRADSLDYDGNTRMPRLSEIRLYAKADPSTWLERYVFDHDYRLAPNTPDSSQGKLTLLGITKYGKDDGESLPPLLFNYGGGLFCGDGVCNYDEDCFSCNEDCYCSDDNRWFEGVIWYEGSNCDGGGLSILIA